MRKWLDQLKSPLQGKDYASMDELAAVIRFRYPRFSAVQAAFVAAAWGKVEAGGKVRLAADPRHHWVNPILYKREDTEASWRELRAPLLLLIGEKSELPSKLAEDGTAAAFRAIFPHIEIAHIADAGHMLHIERPDLVAPLVEDFLDAH
jgi:pimeloyl-ACP methyl ester carboxylesterase